MNRKIYSNWEITQINHDKKTIKEDLVASEYPLTIMVNQIEFATIICTPNHLTELVIGFLASEGIILMKEEIKSIDIDKERGFAYVMLHKKLESIHFNHSKRFISSCCGKSRQFYFKSDVRTARTITHGLIITAKQCLRLMDDLHKKSNEFKQTGGVHNAALCTVDSLLQIRTDIGRHNTLDKLNGYIIENKIPIKDKVIVFTGRISSEVLLKISKMRISTLISTSAPTDLALNLANDLKITVVGFTRNRKMNVYTHKETIIE